MLSGFPLLARLFFMSSGFSRISLISNIFSHRANVVVLGLLGYLTCDARFCLILGAIGFSCSLVLGTVYSPLI
jgi:hypothetical protein